MSVYFAFSDENGDYERIRSAKHLRAHPYFIRATLITDSNEWRSLSDAAAKVRKSLPVGPVHEVKWSHVWSLKVAERDNRHHSPSHPLHFLTSVRHVDLVMFTGEMLALLKSLSFCKIILTVTCNKTCHLVAKEQIYKMHLQEAMQRIEMELDSMPGGEALAVLFVDPVSRDRDHLLRNAYHQIYTEGDFIKKYRHIKDSLNLEYSHQSVGIQLADFTAGCFGGFLRDYPESVALFNTHIKPRLRQGLNGTILGYGIREVPRNKSVRDFVALRTTVSVVDLVAAKLKDLGL